MLYFHKINHAIQVFFNVSLFRVCRCSSHVYFVTFLHFLISCHFLTYTDSQFLFSMYYSILILSRCLSLWWLVEFFFSVDSVSQPTLQLWLGCDNITFCLYTLKMFKVPSTTNSNPVIFQKRLKRLKLTRYHFDV